VHPGAALLAARSGAPVIRVEIHGSAAAWPHGRWWPGPARVQVRFLPPLAAPSGPQGDAGEALQRRIEAWLREVDGEPAGES
jgi:1-acyl-sn-glycerol-3-phosphate acyltransferase